MTAPRIAGVALALTLTSAAAWPLAQQAVFRSGVDVVTVDVSVLDRDGRLVEDLTADAFDVEVDGQPRRVLWAEFVPQGSRPRDIAQDVATSFSSNEHVDVGRLVMVAVDQMHIRRVEGLAALRAASSFIDSLERTDLVTAVPVDHGGDIEFSSDHSAAKRALQRLTGEATSMPMNYNIGISEALAFAEGSRIHLEQVVRRECGASLNRMEAPSRLAENVTIRDPCPVQVEQEGRALAQQVRMEARMSLEALGRLIARLAEIDGPKTLVLLSEGLIAEPQMFDLSALGAAAHAARVTIYVLQLDTPLNDASDSRTSPTQNADRQVRADGLSRLAGAARGALFTLVGSDPQPFRRILRETSGYYLVAFEVSDADRDGQRRRIAVKTRAGDATVRARSSFMVPPPVNMAQSVSHIERMLRSTRISTELPLRMAVYTFQAEDPGTMRVLVTAETNTGAARDVTIGYVVVNDTGVIVASGADTSENGRLTVPTALPPGRYLARAAAVDAGGRQGSVEHRFNAALGGRGDVRVSDLMIADPVSGGEQVLRPSAARASGEKIMLYLEAYGPQDWSPAGSVEFQVVGPGGKAAGEPASVALRSDGPGKWIGRVEVPIGSVPPGAYLAAARVPVGAGEPVRVTRNFVIAR